jgi:hypothetical protein
MQARLFRKAASLMTAFAAVLFNPESFQCIHAASLMTTFAAVFFNR